MTVGLCKFIDKTAYIVVNSSGTLEKKYPIKWYAQLWLEVRQGFGKNMNVVKLRDYLRRFKK